MPPVLSLSEYLGLTAPVSPEAALVVDDTTSAEDFAKAVLRSREFRAYVVNSLVIGNIPSAVVLRIMDLAEWQKPQRIEHTGKNGEPIAIQEVRSIIVDPKNPVE